MIQNWQSCRLFDVNPRTIFAGFKGTVVAITYDRYFLESACQWILCIYLRLLYLELLPRFF